MTPAVVMAKVNQTRYHRREASKIKHAGSVYSVIKMKKTNRPDVLKRFVDPNEKINEENNDQQSAPGTEEAVGTEAIGETSLEAAEA